MLLETFCSGPAATNSILLVCEITHKGVIIDAPPESGRHWVKRLTDLNVILDKLLLTHSHWDHTGDMGFLKRTFNVPLLVHRLDAPNVTDPGIDGLPMWYDIEPVKPDQLLEEGEKISIGELVLEVIHTPGHSPGGVCFYLQKEKTLISGDTLFRGSIGRTDFPQSDQEKMWTSLKKLAKLPPDTLVVPGHGEKTRIGDEMKLLLHAKEYFGG